MTILYKQCRAVLGHGCDPTTRWITRGREVIQQDQREIFWAKLSCVSWYYKSYPDVSCRTFHPHEILFGLRLSSPHRKFQSMAMLQIHPVQKLISFLEELYQIFITSDMIQRHAMLCSCPTSILRNPYLRLSIHPIYHQILFHRHRSRMSMLTRTKPTERPLEIDEILLFG